MNTDDYFKFFDAQLLSINIWFSGIQYLKWSSKFMLLQTHDKIHVSNLKYIQSFYRNAKKENPQNGMLKRYINDKAKSIEVYSEI